MNEDLIDATMTVVVCTSLTANDLAACTQTRTKSVSAVQILCATLQLTT